MMMQLMLFSRLLLVTFHGFCFSCIKWLTPPRLSVCLSMGWWELYDIFSLSHTHTVLFLSLCLCLFHGLRWCYLFLHYESFSVMLVVVGGRWHLLYRFTESFILGVSRYHAICRKDKSKGEARSNYLAKGMVHLWPAWKALLRPTLQVYIAKRSIYSVVQSSSMHNFIICKELQVEVWAALWQSLYYSYNTVNIAGFL